MKPDTASYVGPISHGTRHIEAQMEGIGTVRYTRDDVSPWNVLPGPKLPDAGVQVLAEMESGKYHVLSYDRGDGLWFDYKGAVFVAPVRWMDIP